MRKLLKDETIKFSRKICFAFLVGTIISFCYVAGYELDNYDSLNLMQGKFYLKWMLGICFSTPLLYVLWEGAQKMRFTGGDKLKFRFPRWICMLILLVCWIPAWLSLLPGAFAYDACNEWIQVRDGMLTSHHPVLHVLLLGGLVEGGFRLTGSYNVGIAVYTLFQMVLLAYILTAVIEFLREFVTCHIFQWIALLFFALSPVVQLFAVSATKDVLFSGAELLFLMHVIYFSLKREAFFLSRKRLVFFGISAFFTMTLRNNGLYIAVIILVLMFLCSGKYWRKFAAVLLGITISYGIYVGPVYHVLNVTPGGIEEMLSVPAQQMARVHKYDFETLEEEDLELLYRVLPKENLDEYRGTVSDFVKKGFQKDAFYEEKAEFLKLWLKWGMAHPLTYLNSFLINTVDFWYPGAVVDGYRDSYGKSSYFDYRVDEPGTEYVLLPGVHTYYEAISFDGQVQKLPLAFLILSPGWYFVMFLIVAGYLWCYQKYAFTMPVLIIILHMLTVLLGPMALVRYVLILYFAFPIFLAVFLDTGNFIGEK